MANSIIQIKRSTGNATPSSLNPGELAYSYTSNTLYIGNTTNGPVIIGGQVYMQYLASITPGTLTASRAIVVDTNALIDTLKAGNTVSNVVANSTGVLVSNATLSTNLVPGSLRLANSTSNVTITVPTSAQYTGGNFFLNANGSWTVVAAGVGGSNTQIQFNDSGNANGVSSFTFDKSTVTVFVGNATVNATINSTGLAVANSTSNTKIIIPTTVERAGAYYLKADGTWSTVTAGSALPSGSNTHVQFNDSGVTEGTAGFTFNKVANNVTIGNTVSALIGSFSTSANVGANVSLSTTRLFVGNTTANLAALSTSVAIANATGTATLTPVSLVIGATTIGNVSIVTTTANVTTLNATTSANVGANVSMSTTAHFAGNSTANATHTSGSYVVANATGTATLNPVSLTIGTTTVGNVSIVTTTANVTTLNATTSANVGANVSLSTTRLFVGNTTANLAALSTSLAVANATGTATLTPVSLTIGASVVGNTSVNTNVLNVATSANVGANVILTTSQLFVGNTTVNTTHTSTVLSIVAATTNTTINSSSVFIGNTTANTTIVGGGTTTIANSTGTTTITPVSLSTRDVTVTGNLIVNGTTVSLNVATINIQDSMIRLANGNINTDTIDIGMYGSYGNATTTEFTGLIRKASDKKWYLWANTVTEPNTSLANTTNLATLVINRLETTTAIDPAYGGTGKTSFTGNAVVYTTNTTNMAFVGFGGDGTVLQMQGTTLAFAALDGGAF